MTEWTEHGQQPSIDLRGLISQGESEQLEFKASLVDPEATARTLAGLANSGGGRLVVGVGSDDRIVGVRDPARVEQTLVQASDLIHVPTSTVQLEAGNKHVVIAEVAASEQPVAAPDGGFAARAPNGNRVPIDPAPVGVPASSDLSEQVRELKRQGAEQNRQLVELAAKLDREGEAAAAEREAADAERKAARRSRSFKSRCTDWVIAGLIGAGLAVLVTHIT